MSTFAIATDNDSEELAANMSTFVDKPIAIQALQDTTVGISTEYGNSQALRVAVVDLEEEELTRPHLLYWSKVYESVLRNQADWLVGRIVNVPQKADPTRSVYVFRTETGMTPDDIGNAIQAAELGTVHTVDENAPF